MTKHYYEIAPSGVLVISEVPLEHAWMDGNLVRHFIWSWHSWFRLIVVAHLKYFGVPKKWLQPWLNMW